MNKELAKAGYSVSFNPAGDGDCFFAAAGYQLGLATKALKEAVFKDLEMHQFDVSNTFLIPYLDDRKLNMFPLHRFVFGLLKPGK